MLAPDVLMTYPSSPPPAHSPAPTEDIFTQPHRPIAVSRSEGNMFVPGPNTGNSSIRARVAMGETMRMQRNAGTSRNPLEKYTKATMPMIHDAIPTALYDNIDPDLLDVWDASPGEKVLISPFDNIANELSKHDAVRDLILSAVTDITKANHFSVSTPIPCGEQIPTTFLVYNLSQPQKEALLERYVWASTPITFRATPTDPPCPNFLFSIKGLGTMITKDVHDMVHAIWHDNKTTSFITNLINSAPLTDRRQLTTDLQNFIDSLHVIRLDTKGRGNTLAPHFRVFSEGSIIKVDDIWSQIRTFLADRTYTDYLIGRGIVKVSPYKCTLCHGVDHPRGLCPFPTIKGWNGPTNNRNERGRL